MIGVLRSEIFKLRTTRATKVVIAAAIFLPAIIFVLTSVFSYQNGKVDGSLVASLGNFAPLTALLLGVVGVLCSTQEYSQGTIRITLVATPHRLTVFWAKITTVFLVALASSAALVVVCLVPSKLILDYRDISYDLIGPDIRVLFGVVILFTLMAELGLALGLAFKSSPGAISAFLIWPSILEGLIFGLLSLAFDTNVMKYAPVQGNGFRLVFAYFSEDDHTWLTSLIYFSAFVGLFAALGAVLFSRRDA